MSDEEIIRILTEALQFYARHWWHERVIDSDGRRGHTWDPPFSIRNDHGARAREALTTIEVAKENYRAAMSELAAVLKGTADEPSGES